MDVDVVRSDGIYIDLEIQAEIDECIAYADALRDRGIDARVVVKAIDREEIKTGVTGPVETVEGLKTAGYRVTTAGSRLMTLLKLMPISQIED
ncbi:hypothetical protein Tco_0373690 [Tanacetum coccineum]